MTKNVKQQRLKQLLQKRKLMPLKLKLMPLQPLLKKLKRIDLLNIAITIEVVVKTALWLDLIIPVTPTKVHQQYMHQHLREAKEQLNQQLNDCHRKC